MNRIQNIMYLVMNQVPWDAANYMTDEQLTEHVDATLHAFIVHRDNCARSPEQEYESYYKMRNRYEGRTVKHANDWEPPATLEHKEWWDQPFAGKEKGE